MKKLTILFILIVLVFTFVISANASNKKLVPDPTIYGDRDGTIFLGRNIKASLSKHAFSHFYNIRDKGIIVHLIGDRLTAKMARDFYGVSLNELDNDTRKKGIFFKKRTIFDLPSLVISAKDIDQLRRAYESNDNLREKIEQIINAEVNIPKQTENNIWESSGHPQIVFEGLFENPDYSNLDLFLKEDALTRQTRQVKKVASIINDKKDISTLKEILNLLKAIDNRKRPKLTHEVSASKILSTPILAGCTTYATAFATLCRAKGIPAVVVDSARLDWILDGCKIDRLIEGHFWVEVYIDDTWFLVESTGGKLYKNYDRNNWCLPNEYIAFTKSLSFIDPGNTEENHGLLQRVAFVNKKINYENPNYVEINLNNRQVRNDIKKAYEKLNLEEDNKKIDIKLTGDVFEIKADSTYINFSDIN